MKSSDIIVEWFALFNVLDNKGNIVFSSVHKEVAFKERDKRNKRTPGHVVKRKNFKTLGDSDSGEELWK